MKRTPTTRKSTGLQRLSHSAVSLSRALSKLGFCFRTQAELLIAEGRVCVNGAMTRNSDIRIDLENSCIAVDDRPIAAERKIYMMLNKPRGLVTTRNDPQERKTVYDCLEGLDLPFIVPVGRLDKASEGLLLLTNDTRWAQRVLDPASNIEKVYHVQIDCSLDEYLLKQVEAGIVLDGEYLFAKSARTLRFGKRNAWLEVVLTEGKNRQIRRLFNAMGAEVLRLVRIEVGGLQLGDLPRGMVRNLKPIEKAMLDVQVHALPGRSNRRAMASSKTPHIGSGYHRARA
ncbi:pseudouridine synthase [Microvirga puerhi]|uniref:Pseudouridine synthase n=1 Tax=Microvirga puerhi TaxID=2876078 RepID=A0ABS7VTT9_9HYPH|nr:pseudouridine synthase [Microvirga puerhi]MBZ6078992.1 rRNA pseudouridine synthase [Microvirga puerhi]